MGLAT